MPSPIKVLRLFSVLALFAPAACFAQDNSPNPAAGCAACGGCGFVLFFLIALTALHVALLVWVARDAKARGMDDGILWMLLVFFLGLIGLVIFLLARPQGYTVPCPNCGNKRLQASVRCPHCGAGS